MWFNLVVAFVFLFCFRGWGTLAAVISVATIITYLVGPVSVLALRRTAPELHRPLRIRALPLLAPLAFVVATLMLYWARWPHTGQIVLLLVLPLPVYAYYQARSGWRALRAHFAGAAWLFGYLAAIVLLSWAGSRQFDGRGFLPYGWDQLYVALTALLFCAWGVRSGWSTPALAEHRQAQSDAQQARY
jgi:amino acid transporter